jgi:hypothetical protein
MTEFEAGVRELIARLRDVDMRFKKAENDAGALDQMVKLITPAGPTRAAAGCPNTTITGTVRATLNNTVFGAGALVTIKAADTGDIITTATTNSSGVYTASNITLPNPTANAQNLILETSVPAAAGANYFRYGVSSATFTATCGISNTRNLFVIAGTGYTMLGAAVIVPIKNTLLWTDPKFGNHTLTAVSGTWRSPCGMYSWTDGINGPYNIPLDWSYNSNNQMFVNSNGSATQPPPNKTCTDTRTIATPPTTRGGTLPNLSGTTSMNLTFAYTYNTSQAIYWPGTTNCSLTEV